MGSTLSHDLLDAGFLSVYGTTEKVGRVGGRVHRGESFTWDQNNGISVVYDEEGRPWIKRGSIDLTGRLNNYGGGRLIRGAYVPHSNDGGEFVRQMLIDCERTAPASERKMRGLMVVIEKIITKYQNAHAGNLDEGIFVLFELAKRIRRAEDEEALQLALKEL